MFLNAANARIQTRRISGIDMALDLQQHGYHVTRQKAAEGQGEYLEIVLNDAAVAEDAATAAEAAKVARAQAAVEARDRRQRLAARDRQPPPTDRKYCNW